MNILLLRLEQLVGSKATSMEFNFVEQVLIINCSNKTNLPTEIKVENVIIGYINNFCSSIISDIRMSNDIGIGFWSSLEKMNYRERGDFAQLQILLTEENGPKKGAIEFVVHTDPQSGARL
jgi:hypothetical protein